MPLEGKWHFGPKIYMRSKDVVDCQSVLCGIIEIPLLNRVFCCCYQYGIKSEMVFNQKLSSIPRPSLEEINLARILQSTACSKNLTISL